MTPGSLFVPYRGGWKKVNEPSRDFSVPVTEVVMHIQVACPTTRRSPIPVLTGLGVEQLRWYAQRRYYHYATPPSTTDRPLCVCDNLWCSKVSRPCLYTSCCAMCLDIYTTPWVKKQDTKLLAITSLLSDFQIFFSSRLGSKFATNSCSNIPPRFKHVATLPCEIWMQKNGIILK